MTTRQATSLFWFQVVMACTHVFFQLPKIIKGDVDGLSLVFYSVFFVYVVFSLTLAVSSYKAEKTKDRGRTIWIFIIWGVILATFFVLGLGKIPWDKEDTIVCIVIAIMIVISVSAVILYCEGIRDPFVRASIAMISKGVPQLYLIYAVYSDQSSSGLPWGALLTAHATSMSRLVQVLLSGRKNGWDRPTKGLLCGEIANVLSFCVYTIFWVYYRL
jgi:hypothetical protein